MAEKTLGAEGLAELWSLICDKHDGFVNEYVWAKGKMGEIVEITNSFKDFTVCSKGTQDSSEIIYYSDTPEMQNPTEIYINYDRYTDANVLAGKFFCVGSKTATVYYGDPNGSATRKTGVEAGFVVYFPATNNWWVGSEFDLEAYVNSPDPNAYPPAVADGYVYNFLGQLGGKPTMASGSYFGTGAGDTIFTFDFIPKLLLIQNHATVGMWIYGSKVLYNAANSISSNVFLNGTTLSLRQKNSDMALQFNTSGKVYNYIAFG